MDYGRSFAYMFKQPDVWKKILIGGLLLLVPVIGWLWVGGYTPHPAQRHDRLREPAGVDALG